MVLDTAGKNLDTMRPWPQNALLTVNTSSKTLNITPAYYVFRHVSQYVDPGAKVVGTSGGDALAFKNPDGTIVAVVYNSGAAQKLHRLGGGQAAAVHDARQRLGDDQLEVIVSGQRVARAMARASCCAWRAMSGTEVVSQSLARRTAPMP